MGTDHTYSKDWFTWKKFLTDGREHCLRQLHEARWIRVTLILHSEGVIDISFFPQVSCPGLLGVKVFGNSCHVFFSEIRNFVHLYSLWVLHFCFS